MSEFSDWFHRKFFDYQREQNRVVTKTDFAKYLSVSQQNISNWLSGRSRPTDHETISKIAAQLGDETYDALGMQKPSARVTDRRLADLLAIWDSLSETLQDRLIKQAKAGRNESKKKSNK